MRLRSALNHKLYKAAFSPLNFSWERRLQTLAVMYFLFIWVIMPVMSLWMPFYILFRTEWWFIVPIYTSWFIYDFRTPRKGSRPIESYRNSQIWNYFADYFPLRLIKTARLSPKKNYIIGSHPHGVLSIGIFTTMCTNATGFKNKFPGITPSLMTLNGQFYFPIRRDVGIALGGVESSKESLEYLLETPGKGRAISIVLGGAAEALDAHPGTHELTLSTRRGYCRYALKYGADLVPLYNFGENDVFDQLPNARGTKLRAIQERIKKFVGLCPPLLIGKNIFFDFFGIMPQRKPITSVVGKPIRVEKVENPTEKQIDKLHGKYCSALVELFERYKHLHKIPKSTHLTIH